jgi:predicted DNA-binding transcriptional regulator YafY
MAPHYARHEQFLRILHLYELLEKSRRPLEDEELLHALKAELGLTNLSGRTLRRDCEFLASCGYAIAHVPIHGSRRFGWQLHHENAARRWKPAQPLTLLELVAFTLACEHMRFCEGTVLWTGIEALRRKIEGTLPSKTRTQWTAAASGMHVTGRSERPYAHQPRLLSALCAAIDEAHEIEIEEVPPAKGQRPQSWRCRPQGLAFMSPRIFLVFFPYGPDGSPPHDEMPARLIDLAAIREARKLDVQFSRRDIGLAELLATAVDSSGSSDP